jgi:hypothetical protein
LKEKTAIASAAGVGDAADELGQPLSGEHVAIHRRDFALLGSVNPNDRGF